MTDLFRQHRAFEAEIEAGGLYDDLEEIADAQLPAFTHPAALDAMRKAAKAFGDPKTPPLVRERWEPGRAPEDLKNELAGLRLTIANQGSEITRLEKRLDGALTREAEANRAAALARSQVESRDRTIQAHRTDNVRMSERLRALNDRLVKGSASPAETAEIGLVNAEINRLRTAVARETAALGRLRHEIETAQTDLDVAEGKAERQQRALDSLEERKRENKEFDTFMHSTRQTCFMAGTNNGVVVVFSEARDNDELKAEIESARKGDRSIAFSLGLGHELILHHSQIQWTRYVGVTMIDSEERLFGELEF